ncbi:MAG: hypothetical protein QXS68_02965 [Candidatus Methanomethylicaceae archaeon]
MDRTYIDIAEDRIKFAIRNLDRLEQNLEDLHNAILQLREALKVDPDSPYYEEGLDLAVDEVCAAVGHAEFALKDATEIVEFAILYAREVVGLNV